MSAIDNTPENRNFLSPLNFRFQIKRAPNVNFFIQKANFPSIALQNVETPNPFLNVPYGGDHLSYGELDITFKVDEDLTNYLEIHNWIRSMGRPIDGAEYRKLEIQPSYTGNGLVSDISLTVLASSKMPNYEVVFRDAFPVSLGTLQFDTTSTDVDYLEIEATFKYLIYDIKKIH